MTSEIWNSKAFLCIIATICILVLLRVLGKMAHNTAEYIKHSSPNSEKSNFEFDFENDQETITGQNQSVGQVSKNLQERQISRVYRK